MESHVLEVCPSAGGSSAQALYQVLNVITMLYCRLSDPAQWPNDYGPNLVNGTSDYDFIIVGAGSAGAVVANRLSEISNLKILLIEAGGKPNADSEIPALYGNLQRTELDWNYYTQEETHTCLGRINHTCFWPRGKVLGGSSTINAMLYIRGNKRDYDAWVEMGNSRWSYDNVLKYYKKSEHLNDNDIYNDRDASYYHGFDGDLNVELYESPTKSIKDVIKSAWKNLGYKTSLDINGADQIGITEAQGTVVNGRRCSTSKAFLSPAKDRPNLHIVQNAHVTKVELNEDNRATGVIVTVKDKVYRINCKKEVILSAGSINTPQILMLSGIGPRNHLIEKDIQVVKDLPVGKNLKDHLFAPAIFTIDGQGNELTPEFKLQAALEYFTHNTGVYKTIGISDLVGFRNTLNMSDPVPDAEYIHILHTTNSSENFLRNTNFNEEIQQKLRELNTFSTIIMMAPGLLQPRSTGEILLKSNDPFEKPLIYANYLSDQRDMADLVRAMEFLELLENTTIFKESKIELIDLKLSACMNTKFKTKENWECLIRMLATTLYHPVGTAKMGPKDDNSTVVDECLQVHGIKGLRVIDASIMPDIIRGHTNAAAIMIGEMGSDFIKEYWDLNSVL